MFMRIGNEKSVYVKAETILDIDNIKEFDVLSPYGVVILTLDDGGKIRCKSHDYDELLKIIKLSRKNGGVYIHKN